MRRLYSKATILKTYKAARKGDTHARQKLAEINDSLARTANRRLLELEKAGYDRWAYDRAVAFTQSEYGKERFQKSTKIKWEEDLLINIEEMQTFLKRKSSTVSGNMKIDKDLIDNFRDKGFNITDDNQSDFLDLVTSDSFKELKESYVDSNELVDDIAQLIDYGVDISKIKEALEKVTTDINYTYDLALEDLGFVLR